MSKKVVKKAAPAKKPAPKKAAKNGGYRPRKSPKYREQAFISSLIDYSGGPAKVAVALKVTAAVIVNWRLRGQVATAYTDKAAKFFRVSPGLLNTQVARVAGLGSWEKAARGVAFLKPDQKAKIFALPSQYKSAA